MHISRAMSTSNWSTMMRHIHSKTYQMHRSAVAQHGKHNHHAFKVWWYKTMAASFYAKMIKKSHDLGLVLKWSKFYHPPTTSVVNKQNKTFLSSHFITKKKQPTKPPHSLCLCLHFSITLYLPLFYRFICSSANGVRASSDREIEP